MRFAKYAAVLAALTAFVYTASPAFAEDPQPDTTSLRESADNAANAGAAEANADADKAVVEKVAEAVAGGGEVLPKAGSNPLDGIDNMDEAGEAVSLLVKAFNDKNYFMVTGILLMFGIFGMRKFKVTDKLGITGGGLLAFSISLGVVLSIAIEFTLVEGAFTWAKLGSAALIGATEGLIAGGAWEAAKGHLKTYLT